MLELATSEAGDPRARLEERAREEHDFDWDVELAVLEKQGLYVRPLPIVERVLRLWPQVRAIGFEGALRVGQGTFAGWEVEFLGQALGMLADAHRDAERADQVGLLKSLLRPPPRG